jgi:hypothetical protein
VSLKGERPETASLKGERSETASACCLAALLALPLTACAGGMPLLYPAHTLKSGVVEFGAGTSGHVELGGVARATDKLDAAITTSGAITDQERKDFASGAVARVAVAPGVAPVVFARVGLGGQNEAGLTYTGRSVRLDGRHSFEWSSLALSVGLSGMTPMARPGHEPADHVMDTGSDSGLRSVSLTSLGGYGLELPVLFGYRSSADVVQVWAGLRGGFEHDAFDLTLVEAPDTALATTGNADRYYGGGVVGFSVGLKPIEARAELGAAYQSVSGSLTTQAGSLSGAAAGWSLTPALAISAKF